MDDEEFIEGKLDTGFIARFYERRRKSKSDETSKDLALIASVIAFSEKQKTTNQPAHTEQNLAVGLWPEETLRTTIVCK